MTGLTRQFAVNLQVKFIVFFTYEEKVIIWKQLIFTEEPEYEYYYEYIYEEDLPQFSENLPPSTTFETETTIPTKQTLLETSPRFSEPPHTASNGK